MKRYFVSTIILLSAACFFFYLGYAPEPYQIDISGTFFGYHVQASQYTLYGFLIVAFVILMTIIRSFTGLKGIYNSIIYFFTGRNKEKATENLLVAYAQILGKKPKDAMLYLKKAQKYFKNSPHTALIGLMVEQSEKKERPTSQFIANLENDKALASVGQYVESLFPVSQKDTVRHVELLKNAHNYTQSLPVLIDYLSLLISDKKYDDAEAALKSARNLLSEEDYKFHLSHILTLKSYTALQEKNINNSLAFGQEALKNSYHPIALHFVIQAFKTLQRDNKAARLLHDHFSVKPSMNLVRLFLELKGVEASEDTAKRIAALPRKHEDSEGFMALQAYHFAVARDLISLNTAINGAERFKNSLWVKAAKLCLVVEKDPMLLIEALKIFKDAIYAQCTQEIQQSFSQNAAGKLYVDQITSCVGLPKITLKSVEASLALFKNLLKSIPVISQKMIKNQDLSLEGNDIYRIEGAIDKEV